MPVETKTFNVMTKPELDMVDITDKVEQAVYSSKIKDGLVTVFVAHSTAAIGTIEYEHRLLKDFEKTIERIVPSNVDYKHNEIDDNAKSHIRSTIIGPSLTIPLKNKKLLLGTWQQIVLFDFDVPSRSREITVQIVGE